MVLGARQRRRVTQILGPVLGAALVGYFAYYTVEGERGLIALTRLQSEVNQAQAVLSQTRAEREALELKVVSLRPDSLDLDRLDERTRSILNDSRSDELIINLPGTRPSER